MQLLFKYDAILRQMIQVLANWQPGEGVCMFVAKYTGCLQLTRIGSKIYLGPGRDRVIGVAE